MNDNVIFLKTVKEVKKAEDNEPEYRARILAMDKLELLNEMMRFQEERSTVGHLTVGMMVRGGILFKALEKNAETEQLKALAKSYHRHLKFELEAHLNASNSEKKAY